MKTGQVLGASALRAVASEFDCYGTDMAVLARWYDNCHVRAIAVYTSATKAKQLELDLPESILVRTGRLDRLNTLASQIVIVIELLIVELNSKDLSPKDDRVLPFVPR